MNLTSSHAIKTEQLKGTVERVTFHSEETGFCVLRVKVKGQHELQTVIANAAAIQVGEFIECNGFWINDKQYGLQFKAAHLEAVPPTTLEGMEKYLASGMIKGIGVAYAKRLIKVFQENVFEVIENTPYRLCEVEGIGEKRRECIIAAWHEHKKIRDIMVFLQSHGVGTARAVRIYKIYKEEAINKVKNNPYLLAQDIHGIGFKTADQLAQRIGIAKDSILRIRAGVVYALQNYTANGHCGIEKENLLKEAAILLEVDESLIQEALVHEIAHERITEVNIKGTSCYFLTSLYLSEKGIAQHCDRLLRGEIAWTAIDSKKAIEWVQIKTGIILSDSQRKAVELVISSKLVIVTGGPGVGKTTLLNSIIKIIKTKQARILLAAPTGRAAKRLSEATGLEAKTLHRLLEFDPSTYQFKRQQNMPLQADLIVIDESSMVDVALMNQFLRAVPDNAALVLVGDVDQLPSVGPGMVLKDMIASEKIPTVRLTEIFRQAATSQIITNAHKINRGEVPIKMNRKEDPLSDFYTILCEEPEEIKAKVLTLITERIPKKFNVNPIQDIQVLTPTKKGGLGAVSLNIELQKKLNPQEEVIKKYGNVYGIKDKVIQTVNNYDKEVFNGDIGNIEKIDLEENAIWINFDGRLVEYDSSELDEINLAYATTIHKSQGSEYPVVIIPLSMQHYMLLERNLLYTGVTRGKNLVIIVGQMKAIAMATKHLQAQKRLTYLQELLIGRMA